MTLLVDYMFPWVAVTEMTFGIGKISYTALYDTERTIQAAITKDLITTGDTVNGPNKDAKFNLAHLLRCSNLQRLRQDGS